ncbi:MAG: hypothetical protein KF883_04480 [Thermomicrobiales bacterium]|nr:hypothetical protein [Thermomicrobiales bacterium]
MTETSWKAQRLIWIVLAAFLALGGGSPVVLAQDEATPESEEGPDASQSELASELPPPDLPTSNVQGYTFELNSTTTVDLAAVPREAVVYALNWREASASRTERIANNLGITGEVNDRGNGTFDIGDENGEIFVSSDLVQFFTTATPDGGDLPGDEDAITFARDWLRTAGLLPNSADDGRVIARSEETQRVVVQFLPLEPQGLIAAYPSVLVTEGPGGFVVESSIRWPSIERADLYQLRDANEAWQEIASGQAFLDLQLPEGIADENGVVRGDATYSRIDIGYTTAGLPGGSQYLVPIYIFSGRFTPADGGESYRIRAFVSGVANAGAPVG